MVTSARARIWSARATAAWTTNVLVDSRASFAACSIRSLVSASSRKSRRASLVVMGYLQVSAPQCTVFVRLPTNRLARPAWHSYPRAAPEGFVATARQYAAGQVNSHDRLKH